MNTNLSRLISLMLAIVPMMTAAQTGIRSAFDAIIKCPDARITECHTLDKDPETNIKTGQSDIYNFAIPSGKIRLIKNAIDAFDKESETAYSVNSGKSIDSSLRIELAIGETGENRVYINEPDYEYVYSLFLPTKSEDPEGKYRYAYGINYKEGGDTITGKLIVTYATTLKYRQQAEIERQKHALNSYSNGSDVVSSIYTYQPTLFSTLMTTLNAISNANPRSRVVLAVKAYDMIKEACKSPEMTDVDKDTIRDILKVMLNDKKYADPMLNEILSRCLVVLS